MKISICSKAVVGKDVVDIVSGFYVLPISLTVPVPPTALSKCRHLIHTKISVGHF